MTQEEVGANISGNKIRQFFKLISQPSGLLLVASFFICVFSLFNVIDDPDFWWHLRTGQLILQNHGLLGTDPYTYTAIGHQWVMHEYLTEVSYALLYKIGGISIIAILLCVISVYGVWLIYLRTKLRISNNFIIGGGVILTTLVGLPIWGPRVQMLTFALFCLTLFMIDKYFLSSRSSKKIWLFVPLMLVWSNFHSGFVIGLAFMVLALVAEIFVYCFKLKGAVSKGVLITFTKVIFVCLLVVGINPNGPRIYLYAIQTQFSVAQQQLIQEWQSPDFHITTLLPLELMLASLIFLLIFNRKLRLRDALFLLVTTVLVFQSVRHIVLFLAVASPLWMEQVQLLLHKKRESKSTKAVITRDNKALKNNLKGSNIGPKMLVAGVLLILLMGLDASKIFLITGTTELSYHYAKEYPVCASQWLEQAPGNLKVFNQYGEGGFLINALANKNDKIFIFGDAALMGDSLLFEFNDIASLKPQVDKDLIGSGTDVVLYDKGTALDSFLKSDKNWTLVYQDNFSVVYALKTKLVSLDLPPQPKTSQLSAACLYLQQHGLPSSS